MLLNCGLNGLDVIFIDFLQSPLCPMINGGLPPSRGSWDDPHITQSLPSRWRPGMPRGTYVLSDGIIHVRTKKIKQPPVPIAVYDVRAGRTEDSWMFRGLSANTTTTCLCPLTIFWVRKIDPSRPPHRGRLRPSRIWDLAFLVALATLAVAAYHGAGWCRSLPWTNMNAKR